MTEPTDRPTPRPRPRPRAAVAGQRKRAAQRAAPAKAAPAKAAPARAAPAKAAPAKRPVPSKSPASKATASKATASKATATKAAAARTALAKQALAKKAVAKTPPPKSATSAKPGTKATPLAPTARRKQRRSTQQRGVNLVLVVLSVLTLMAAVAVTALIVQRVSTPAQLDPDLLPAAADAYSAMYSFDYTAAEASVQATLAVLTGDLREQFEEDLDAEVVPAYLEVSATTRVDDISVGLQAVNDDQTEAVVIAYGTFVVKSVNSGQQASPAGSECAVTADGADACVQTLQLDMANVDGTWLVSAVTTLTTS